MKKYLFLSLALSLATCLSAKHYASLDAYPEKKGSLREMYYSPAETRFSLWSPAAKSVTVQIYASAEAPEAERVLRLKRGKDGAWTGVAKGDLIGKYYTFLIQQPGCRWQLHETPGIFATAVGVNGHRAAIIDMARTNPEGWASDKRPALAGAKDAIVYEMHHRDYSIHPSSGVKHPGKFLALTEPGTRSPEGIATGIDHLRELGVTHVQILPSYDFGSIDEEHAGGEAVVLASGAAMGGQYNWGYDPKNYNVPEGSYSTNPHDPYCRIRELKQMIQALHRAGIRVIMDVVYNHTYDVENSQFTQTAPDYFYRLTPDGQLGNASGCGNETASDRAMMRRFIVESVRYWVEEYHMDGFRFDLMGIHDMETMREVRAMLDEIDPSLMLYGEGWTAGTAQIPTERLALKANVPQMPGIGAFCDDMRDAIRGPFMNDHEPAWLDARQGHDHSIRFGLVGCIAHPEVDMSRVNYSQQPWCVEPTQCIAYVSCHDDMMLTDRIMTSIPVEEGELKRLHKLAETAVLTSQGVPFIWCGEEVLRNKKGVHNSYCSPDSINQIDWSLLSDHSDLMAYYSGLIALRKSHPAFHMGSAELVRRHMHFLPSPEGVVAFHLDGRAVGDEWADIVVILNNQRRTENVVLPEGEYTMVCAEGVCPTAPEKREGIAAVAAQSAMILYR